MGEIKERFALEADKTALLVIDLQEKLVPAMQERLMADALKHNRLLIDGFKALGLPVLSSVQYPKGLGTKVADLAPDLEPIEKTEFSCGQVPECMAALEKAGIRQVVLTGIESHVCVYLTAIDLLDKGYRVHVARDAVASRFTSDYEQALANIAEAGGVVTTTEMVLFHLVRKAGVPGFKEISALARKR